MFNQIIICRFTLSVPCQKMLWLPHHQAIYNGVFSSTKSFKWILHHYNLLTYSNDHRKNSSYNYIIFICFIYFYIIFHFFSENNYIINMHTILLTKYEIRIQRQSNIYIWIPQKLTQIWHFIIIMHDIAWYCTGADGIIHPGWMIPTVISKPKYNYIYQLVNINTHLHIKLWSFIAIQYCSNICPNWLNSSFGSSLYGVKYNT